MPKPVCPPLCSGLRTLLDTGAITVVEGFGVHTVRRHDTSIQLIATDGRTVTADRVVVATGFRADHSIASELRLDVDAILGCTRTLAGLIDPNENPRSAIVPHDYAELAHPEPNYYTARMKSYGRAPTFLMATGYGQVRSIAAALVGDVVDADDIQLNLPETGVCGTGISAEQAGRDIAARLGIDPELPGAMAATIALLPPPPAPATSYAPPPRRPAWTPSSPCGSPSSPLNPAPCPALQG